MCKTTCAKQEGWGGVGCSVPITWEVFNLGPVILTGQETLPNRAMLFDPLCGRRRLICLPSIIGIRGGGGCNHFQAKEK